VRRDGRREGERVKGNKQGMEGGRKEGAGSKG